MTSIFTSWSSPWFRRHGTTLSEYPSTWIWPGLRSAPLAYSLLDVIQPAMDEGDDYYEHWVLSHFLLDGHPKIEAAAAAGDPSGSSASWMNASASCHRRNFEAGRGAHQVTSAEGRISGVRADPCLEDVGSRADALSAA